MRRPYVSKGPRSPKRLALPKQRIGRTFIDGDGTQYDVLPMPSTDWPIGCARDTQEAARLHLRKPE